jgi:hypothetical protein
MPADDLDRDKLYSAGGGADDDDGADYELEPPDPELLAAEKRRAAEALEIHKKSIDIDEIYRDFDARRDSEIIAAWVERLRNFRFQFQVKHLLALTAAVAMLLAVRNWIGLGRLVVIGFMFFIAGVTLYLHWEEQKRQEAADRKRERMYAERRAHLGIPGARVPDEVVAEPAPNPLDEIRRQAAAARQFRFKFSLSQLLIVVTCAAILLGLVTVLGGASNAAALCGLFALGGLVIYACGYQPPEIVVFGWWVLLLLYVALNVFSAIWARMGGA